ncbi:hypothetical protein NHX12_011247, partial [Muraenolepis orangiensis]
MCLVGCSSKRPSAFKCQQDIKSLGLALHKHLPIPGTAAVLNEGRGEEPPWANPLVPQPITPGGDGSIILMKLFRGPG